MIDALVYMDNIKLTQTNNKGTLNFVILLLFLFLLLYS